MDGMVSDGNGGMRPMTAKELRQHNEQDGRIDLGLCPNACGPLVMAVDGRSADCPICKFHYWRNTPWTEAPHGRLE